MSGTQGGQTLGGLGAFCRTLDVTTDEWDEAIRESRYNYIKRRNKQGRELCHPPKGSALQIMQRKVKARLLAPINLSPEVHGYRKGCHNINTCELMAGAKYLGTLDISKFHPSISTRHIISALQKHGVQSDWARRIAQLATFEGRVPQGAPTSNHIANLVVDVMLRRAILPFSIRRGVRVYNFGDDIAFVGGQDVEVRACVRHGKAVFTRYGFTTNEKKRRDCEHRGGARRFIGCATGRRKPDYPRRQYRDYRKEVRAHLQRLRGEVGIGPHIGEKELLSIKHKIAYIGRLNRRKARRLMDIFHRICASYRVRAGLVRVGVLRSEQVDRGS